MKEMICILCPKGCHLQIEKAGEGYTVKGNGCEKGAGYAIKELTAPTRVVTSTVCIEGAKIPRLPVKTDRDIPKEDIFRAMRLLDTIVLQAPVELGQIVVENVCGTGANFVATRTLRREQT